MHIPPNITIKKLSLNYKEQHLFADFDFQMPAKKWICILGPSGVGKSTLLRFLAGLPNIDVTALTGTIITSDQLPLDNRIAYMAQQDLLMPWLSVIDNVLIGYHLRGTKITADLKQQAITLLQHAGLENINHLRPAQLSGGMRQRVALVRTLMEDRPVVLMDEPFSALDTITRLKLQNLAATMLAERTVLLVTHDPLEALRLGDYICIMSGSPAQVYEAVELKTSAPRDPTDKRLLTLHAKLLKMLAERI